MDEKSKSVSIQYMQTIPIPTNIKEFGQIGTIFFQSGMFKDIKSAAQAVVKIMAGAEMGMRPFEAMQSLNIIEGKIEMNADASARAIKRSGKYDYCVLKLSHQECEIEFLRRNESAGGEQEWITIGISRFDMSDVERAGLLKSASGTTKSTYAGYTRNMLFARAMTNGYAWFVPDAVNFRIYAPGEISGAIDAKHQLKDPIHVPSSIEEETEIADERKPYIIEFYTFIMDNKDFRDDWKRIITGMYNDIFLSDDDFYQRVVKLFNEVNIDIEEKFRKEKLKKLKEEAEKEVDTMGNPLPDSQAFPQVQVPNIPNSSGDAPTK